MKRREFFFWGGAYMKHIMKICYIDEQDLEYPANNFDKYAATLINFGLRPTRSAIWEFRDDARLINAKCPGTLVFNFAGVGEKLVSLQVCNYRPSQQSHLGSVNS